MSVEEIVERYRKQEQEKKERDNRVELEHRQEYIVNYLGEMTDTFDCLKPEWCINEIERNGKFGGWTDYKCVNNSCLIKKKAIEYTNKLIEKCPPYKPCTKHSKQGEDYDDDECSFILICKYQKEHTKNLQENKINRKKYHKGIEKNKIKRQKTRRHLLKEKYATKPFKL